MVMQSGYLEELEVSMYFIMYNVSPSINIAHVIKVF